MEENAKSNYEKKKKYNKAWNSQNIKKYTLKFMKKTEADILEEFEKQPNKSGYLKSLIRKDMIAKGYVMKED